jgi:dehydrogenase/reductase SDR family protein 1
VGIPLLDNNSETPQFTGRAVVALATDPENLRKTGTYQVVAELAAEYNFTDINGKRPPSIRSLRFLLPTYGFDKSTREKIPVSLIPDWKLPFWLMAQGQPPQEDA